LSKQIFLTLGCLRLNILEQNYKPSALQINSGLKALTQEKTTKTLRSSLPYGELFFERRMDYWNTPYKFNAKELDEETGMYYYGARYYTAEVSIWLSVDPLADKYPSMSPYIYCAGNPVILVDPNGRHWYKSEAGNVIWKEGDAEEINVNGETFKSIGTYFFSVQEINGAYLTCEYGDSPNPFRIQLRPKNYQQPGSGTVETVDNLTQAEMWLDSPSESIADCALKIAGNIGYSIANSPYSLLTGRTIGGTSLNPSERMDAFVDVAPGLVSMGLSKTGQVIKTTKGLKGYNKFVEKSPGITLSKGLPSGMKWQTRAGKLFQANKIDQQALKSFDIGRNTLNLINQTKKEINK
jgi:RHS repeat-associated protein